MDHRVPEVDAGSPGLAEEEAGVARGVGEVEGAAQDGVEEGGVLVEAMAEEGGVDLLELARGGEAAEEEGLDLRALAAERGGGRTGGGGHVIMVPETGLVGR